MGLSICNRCQSRYIYDDYSPDTVHLCTEEFGEVLRDEDVLVIGDWEDYTGSETEPSQTLSKRGTQNRLWATRPDIEGEPPLPLFTIRGKSTSTYRTRQHREYNIPIITAVKRRN